MQTDPTEESSFTLVFACDGGFTQTRTQSSEPVTKTTPYDGIILQYAYKMKTKNYSDETTERNTRILHRLATAGLNLDNPQETTAYIATQKQWTDGTKARTIDALRLYYTWNNITAELTRYKTETRIPFIPLETELDQLISGCKHQLATFLQTLKEIAARYGEAYLLKWTDLNTEASTLTINQPEKHSLPRTLKISIKLMSMLAQLPHEKTNIFQYQDKNTIRKMFIRARKRIAHNTGNPRLLQIHFHTFRHWKATTEYHKTNNLIRVQRMLGHKNLNNTQRYIQLLPDQTDDYVCEVAQDVKQAFKLIENGYEYVTGEYNDGGKLFKKRK
jgi:integrase